MTDRPLRDRKKAETRHAIASTALRLFLERSFDAVSIADIARAANVSKMTVFNYFPAKEDLFFSLTQDRMPHLGQAIRDRPHGTPPLTALRQYLRAELERHADWTGLHQGVGDFARLVFASPTLTHRFAREWQRLEEDLAVALSEATGTPHTVPNVQHLYAAALHVGGTPPQDPSALLNTLTSRAVGLRLAVAQLLAVIQQLVTTNQLRQLLGADLQHRQQAALQEFEAAFDGLEHGLNRLLT